MTDHGPECPCESCVELSSCYTVGPDGKIDRVFVHGPYGPPYETVTFEEAMKGLPSPFVPPLEPTPAREFLRELDALTGFEGAESPLPEGALERALQKLGITNPTGHALGCRCGRCAKTRAVPSSRPAVTTTAAALSARFFSSAEAAFTVSF